MEASSEVSKAASARLGQLIDNSRALFAELLGKFIHQPGATREQYIRYLTMQYHLTREVQTHFVAAAGHRDLAKRRKLRQFLFDFANEEELHYIVAANDLAALGAEVGAMPFDTVLWHGYFRGIAESRPFIRLGAAVILENISGGVARPQITRAMTAPFLTKSNSKFLILHQHETLPHGEQILHQLDHAELDERHLSDLAFGAAVGTLFYLRLAEWAISPAALSRIADTDSIVDETDRDRAGAMSMSRNHHIHI